MRTKLLTVLTARLLMAGAAALALSSCTPASIEGSGNVVSEARRAGGFDGIELEIDAIVVLVQGDEESVTVRADDNLMRHIVTDVRGGVLRLGFDTVASKAAVEPTTRIKFDVTFRELSDIAVRGAGSVELGRLKARSLELYVDGPGDMGLARLEAESVRVVISGSGEINMDGRAVRQHVEVAGGGRYRGLEFATREASVSVSGPGLAVVNASERLDVKLSGGGTVRYAGEPRITKTVDDTGRVEPVRSH